MSVTSEITRLKNAKTSLKTAINNKLGTSTKIANEKIDQYATFVNNITTGTGANLNDYFLTNSTEYTWRATKAIKKMPIITTSNYCTSLRYAFEGFSELLELDLSNFDTSKVTDMSSAFYGCGKLTNLDLSNFDTSKVTDMLGMFRNCTSLTSLDITGWNLQSVKDVQNMFWGCTNLTTITGNLQNLGQNFDTTKVSGYPAYWLSFGDCPKLTEQSLINILNGLYDIATKGCNSQRVTLGETNLAKLTSTEGQNALAQAQSYGWIVS